MLSGKDLAVNESGVSTLTVSNIDKIAPTVTLANSASTTSSITVTATASDTGGSVLVLDSYQYSKDNGVTWTPVTSETSYTFTALSTGTYDCKVRVVDNAGNIGASETLSITTVELGTLTISANPITWTNGNVTVTINYPTEVVTKQYSIDGTTWNTYTAPVIISANDTTVYAKGLDAGANQTMQATLTVSNIDKISPTVDVSGSSTSSSVTVVAVANDTGGSNLALASYQYSKDNGVTWTTATTATSHTFTALSTGTYQCKVKVVDNAGNVTISSAVGLTTAALGTITLGASPSTWTNGNVTVTISYPVAVVTKQYSTNGTTWNTYTVPVVVTTNNTTVYAKGLDSAGNQTAQATLTVTNIDKTVPTVVYGTNGATGYSASTTATVSDVGGSAVNASTLQYVWDTQNTTTPSAGWVTFTNGQTLTKGSVTGTYYLWIKASDNAGNSLVSKTNAFILTQPVAVNAPVLPTGMTAKKWNGSSWVTVVSPGTDTTWYNYTAKEWANAQTADGSMWVWIPRYEYKITTPHSSTAQTIAVNFLINTPTTPTSGYTVHPAFTFGSTQLTGIWVAKFEASGTTTAVDVKPSATSLRSLTIGTAFTACRNMETTYGTRYGWGTSGTGIDTHLTKNVEWGAVAYLSSSIYGKTGEVWINPNSNFLTGQAGTGVNNMETTTTFAYNTANGINASTTGNIYGIYDMNGGAYEYTASYVNNGNSYLTSYGPTLVSAAAQYKDVYTKGATDTYANNYAAASGKKGDALYETSTAGSSTTSWYGDFSYMAYFEDPFFVRGGSYRDEDGAGLFYFIYAHGIVNASIGFRPTLAVSAGL